MIVTNSIKNGKENIFMLQDYQVQQQEHIHENVTNSELIIEHDAFYDMLEQTQRGSLDITLWLSWFLDCLYHAMDHTEETLSAVANRARFWEKNRGKLLNSRQQYMVSTLLDEFYDKLTSTKWAKMTKSSPDTALRDIQDLIEKGILEKEPGGGRNTTYALIMP